jgi:iron only hydrogenase large subunit-like protein
MSCDGGCINGPAGIADAVDVRRQMNKENATHKVTIDEALERIGYKTEDYHLHRK